MGLVVVTPPAAEPLSLAEFKLAARVTNSAEDTLITDVIIPAARRKYELDTRRQLVQATYDYFFTDFPPIRSGEGSQVELPRPPLDSITSVKYYDEDGVQQTLDASKYLVTSGRDPGVVYPAPGEQWPVTQTTRLEERVTIRYVTGELVTDLDPTDKLGVQLLALHWFENREAVVVEGVIKSEVVPLGYEQLVLSRQVVEV